MLILVLIKMYFHYFPAILETKRVFQRMVKHEDVAASFLRKTTLANVKLSPLPLVFETLSYMGYLSKQRNTWVISPRQVSISFKVCKTCGDHVLRKITML